MRLRLLIINLLIIKITVNGDKNFIVNYFLGKNPARIVGFSCGSLKDNMIFAKVFNEKGISTKIVSTSSVLSYDLLKADYYKTGVFFDVRCRDNSSISRVLSEATLSRLYDELHHWLVITNNLSKTAALVQDKHFGLWTDFVVAVDNADGGYKLYDFYNPNKLRGGRLNVTFFGSWTSDTGFNISLTQSKYRRRINLYGMPWKVSFFGSKYRSKNVSLEDHFQDYAKTGTKDGPSKFGYNVIKHLAELHNATLYLNEYVKWTKNDRMGPLTKALQYEEADFCGTPISVLSDKLKFSKIVYTCWPFRTCFILRSPQSSYIKVGEVLNPLAENVWYLYSAISVLFVLVLSMSLHFEHVESLLTQWSNAIIMTVGCLCQQGTNIKMDLLSTRIVFITIMIYGLLIYNYYSASVVSARLKEQITKMNDSMDILAATNIDVASEPMVYFDFLMKENSKRTEVFIERKWNKIPEDKRFIPPEKGMHLVKLGGFAYHTHPDVGYPYINRLYDNREICELAEVHLAKPSLRSLFTTFNSSFSEISKIGFLKISEVGIQNRQLIRWKARKPVCRNDVLSATSTTIYEFAPHLILLVIGMIFSMMMFVTEICLVNHQRQIKFELKMKQHKTLHQKFIFTPFV